MSYMRRLVSGTMFEKANLFMFSHLRSIKVTTTPKLCLRQNFVSRIFTALRASGYMIRVGVFCLFPGIKHEGEKIRRRGTSRMREYSWRRTRTPLSGNPSFRAGFRSDRNPIRMHRCHISTPRQTNGLSLADIPRRVCV